jgi:hypothetical protein
VLGIVVFLLLDDVVDVDEVLNTFLFSRWVTECVKKANRTNVFLVSETGIRQKKGEKNGRTILQISI